MYESIYKKNELENELSLDMSYFLYSDATNTISLLMSLSWILVEVVCLTLLK
jgi:hypothetical protein